MKAISTLTLIAVIAAFTFPNTARAGDNEKALIGGLIGGLIIGAAIADDDTHVSVGYRSGGHRGHHRDHGYWKWVSVKTWVPGYHERSCDRYGRVRKIWVSGHFSFHREKVWVDTRHGRGHRGHDYGHHRRDGGHRDYRHGGHRDYLQGGHREYRHGGHRDHRRTDRHGTSGRIVRQF